MNRETFNNEVKRRLQELSRKETVFFAWLCAARALPYLGYKGDFKFWDKEKIKLHTYSVFRALDYSVGATANPAAYATATRAAAYAAARAVTTAYTYEAYVAAYAAAYAAATTYSAYANATTYATYDVAAYAMTPTPMTPPSPPMTPSPTTPTPTMPPQKIYKKLFFKI